MSPAEQTTASAPLVTLDAVGVRFQEAPIFEEASLEIAASEMVAIVGRNGSGKSTLLRCIAGLQEHDGRITFRATPEARPETRRWATRLARWTLAAPLALVFVALAALFISSVAYNLFDWLRNEGSCDPANPIVVRCEPGFERDAAAWLGEGLTHDVTAWAYGPFYYEDFDWGMTLDIALWMGLLLGALTLASAALWWLSQAQTTRRRFAAELGRRLLELGLASGLAAAGLALLSETLMWAPLLLALALLPIQVSAAAAPPRPRITYIPQRLGLVERATVLDNVLHGLLARRTGVGRWLGMFGVWRDAEVERARACLSVVGIPELEERRVESLSGGERRRVTMARALIQRADLLLADEFLSEVDAATADRLVEHLRGLAREHGTAVVFVEHDLELAVTASDRAFQMSPAGLEPYAGGDLD